MNPLKTVEYRKLKQIWPSQPREFCDLVQWHLLPNGSVVQLSFSDKFNEVLETQGVTRAEMILSAYVLSPLSDGLTEVLFLTQVK